MNGYFSMSEMALTTAKRASLEHDAEEGDKRATAALELAADSTDFLATIQVAITTRYLRVRQRSRPTRFPIR